MDTFTDSPRDARLSTDDAPRRDYNVAAASDNIAKMCTALAGTVDAFETRLAPVLLDPLPESDGEVVRAGRRPLLGRRLLAPRARRPPRARAPALRRAAAPRRPVSGRSKRLVVRRSPAVPGCPACEPMPPFDGKERAHPAHTHPIRRRQRWLGIAGRVRTFGGSS